MLTSQKKQQLIVFGHKAPLQKVKVLSCFIDTIVVASHTNLQLHWPVQELVKKNKMILTLEREIWPSTMAVTDEEPLCSLLIERIKHRDLKKKKN